MSRAESQARYAASPKGRAARSRYKASPKGKAADLAAKARYNASPKGKAANALWWAQYTTTHDRREHHREYRESEHGQLIKAQYEASAAGFLSGIRHNANQRGNR